MSEMRMSEHAVVVAGGGPTGMVLAAELTLAGIDVVIVERRTSRDLDGSRAGGLHARSLEVLDQRGVAERFTSEGQAHPMFGFADTVLDLSDLPTRFPYVLGLVQRHIERILAGWVLDDLAVPIRRGVEVVGLTQDETGVDVEISDGTTLRARYVVGCDGGRSVVRKAAGIDFPGLDASRSWMIAEVEMDGEPVLGFKRDADGQHALGRRGADEPIGVVITDPEVRSGEPAFDELRTAITRIWGTDFGLRRATWISRFSDVSRQAAAYRAGRVLVAGDAAHIHPPQGGQGLNTGVQDAVNLGWKLAQVVRGSSPDSLLDTYHDERHPVGARVLQNTKAQIAAATYDDRHQALREILGELIAMDEPRRHIGAMLTALAVRYDLGDGHPLVGRRMPDLDLATASGPTRVYEQLRSARPILLDLSGHVGSDPTCPPDRVTTIPATTDPTCELPVLGTVDVPPAILVRPDGHVAWTGEIGDPTLGEAVTRWFGAGASDRGGGVASRRGRRGGGGGPRRPA